MVSTRARVATLVALAACLVLAAASTATASTAAREQVIVIGVSHYAGVIPFYRSMTAGIRAAAKKYGIKVIVTDSNFDPSKQVANIESLIAKKVDLIIASPGDENALIPGYKAAFDAGIPIMSVANHIASRAKRYEASFYGREWDSVSAVRTAVLMRSIGGEGEVIAIRGPSGIAFVRDEERGFKRILKNYANVKVVFDQHAKNLSPEEGLRLAQDALTAHPNVGGIWVENDDLASGVVRALQERGLAGKIPVVSLDGTPAGLDLVAEGKVTYTGALPTYSWALDFVKLARDFLVGGKPLPKLPKAKVIPVTRANAEQLIAQCPTFPAEVWCAGRK